MSIIRACLLWNTDLNCEKKAVVPQRVLFPWITMTPLVSMDCMASSGKHFKCTFSLSSNIPTGRAAALSLQMRNGLTETKGLACAVGHGGRPRPAPPPSPCSPHCTAQFPHCFSLQFPAAQTSRHPTPSGPPLCHLPPLTSHGDVLEHTKHARILICFSTFACRNGAAAMFVPRRLSDCRSNESSSPWFNT